MKYSLKCVKHIGSHMRDCFLIGIGDEKYKGEDDPLGLIFLETGFQAWVALYVARKFLLNPQVKDTGTVIRADCQVMKTIKVMTVPEARELAWVMQKMKVEPPINSRVWGWKVKIGYYECKLPRPRHWFPFQAHLFYFPDITCPFRAEGAHTWARGTGGH